MNDQASLFTIFEKVQTADDKEFTQELREQIQDEITALKDDERLELERQFRDAQARAEVADKQAQEIQN